MGEIGSIEKYNLGLISNNVGGLVGDCDGCQINNSYNLGLVVGESLTGGITGVGHSPAIINNCYNLGEVRGLTDIGGLTGTGISIINSYNEGNVIADGDYVGGLAGRINILSGSYNIGNVSSGGSQVGGLVGQLSYASVENSYNYGSVSGNEFVGGAVGIKWYSSITNSYSIGIVEGSSDVGGLIGSSTGGSISSSYYDTNTSGQIDSTKGLPKTTVQMKQQATYESWDFLTIWEINEGVSYPALAWQD